MNKTLNKLARDIGFESFEKYLTKYPFVKSWTHENVVIVLKAEKLLLKNRAVWAE